MKSSRRKLLVGTLLVCAAGSVIGFFAWRNLGYWLVINEPLRHSQAIVVIGGQVPFRAMEAGRLWHEGWAPEVWLTHPGRDANDIALAKLGIPISNEYDISRIVLVKLGVPASAIRLVPDETDNTVAEVRAIARLAASSQLPVIIVTSKFHTRRVRVLADRTGFSAALIVRFTPDDPFDPRVWWDTTTDAIAAFHEVFGILNAWAGFPISPREH